MKYLLILIILVFGQIFYVNAQADLSADDILNKSIDFCGGIKNISKIKSSSIIYDMTAGDGRQGSLVIKRDISHKYMRSVLSDNFAPTSMFFNGAALKVVDGEKVTLINDLNSIEEIKLQTYDLIQYGYKELSYKLKRLDDQKFKAFDCYVLKATAPDGYATLNYFDKTNFRLIMVIYPKGNRSLLMEYAFKDSVLVNLKILNAEENSDQMTLTLRKLDNNIDISPIWFSCENSETTAVPDYIRTGNFVSADGATVKRSETTQIENGANFNSTLSLNWYNNYGYVIQHIKSINEQNPSQTNEKIYVKIVSWDKDGYACHYYTKQISGTAEYKIKK